LNEVSDYFTLRRHLRPRLRTIDAGLQSDGRTVVTNRLPILIDRLVGIGLKGVRLSRCEDEGVSNEL
jgi:hypothetical protein